MMFSGPQGKDAMRARREKKRIEAELRQEVVRPERTKRYRRDADFRRAVDEGLVGNVTL